MKTGQYRVETMEHDSTPWSDDILRSRAGAWKVIRDLAAKVVEGWEHPIVVKVYRGKVLVFESDLRELRGE
jgi:hypothetical protein